MTNQFFQIRLQYLNEMAHVGDGMSRWIRDDEDEVPQDEFWESVDGVNDLLERWRRQMRMG